MKCRFYQAGGKPYLHKGIQNRHLNSKLGGAITISKSMFMWMDGFLCTFLCHNHQCSFTERSFSFLIFLSSSSPSFPGCFPPSLRSLQSSQFVSSGLSGILWDLSANKLTPTISRCSYSNIPRTLGTSRSNAVALQGHFQPLSKKISK